MLKLGPVKMRTVPLTMALTMLLAVGGCGPSRPHTIPVAGVVTLEGQPIADAAVQFIPVGGGRPAQAVTNAAGQFTLSTFADGDGALPGKHNVTVQKSKVTGAAVDVDGLEAGAATGEPTIEWLVPQKYSQPDTSGLTVDVVAGMSPVTLELHADE